MRLGAPLAYARAPVVVRGRADGAALIRARWADEFARSRK
jgi:hypothetical protein